MRLPLAVISALTGLAAMLAGAILSLAPAAADEHLDYLNKLPDNLELVLSLSSDPDNVVHTGREFTVEAALRYTVPRFESPYDPYRRWIIPRGSDSELRIGGGLAWEAGSGSRLMLAEQANIGVVGWAQLEKEPGTSRLKAFNDRTIITRVQSGANIMLRIYDAWSKQLAGTITKPAAASGWFGEGGITLAYAHLSESIAVWHETDSTAWLFVSNPADTVEGKADVGRVYVYRLDWGDRLVEATLVTTLEPPLSEFNNRWGGSRTYYSTSLNLSDDGSTLAVAASDMNSMGAVYVYTRPDGPGQNWGDIRYEDGVKVTPVAIPSHGSSQANAPFNHNSTGRTGAATDCDAYCSRAYSFINNFVEIGVRFVGLSADGRVLTAGASEKEYSMETPGGSFGTSPWLQGNKGEVYVWVAPEGGWNAAPRADMDEQGNPKTLIEAKADARSFDPATHYSPGPLRRVTKPDAVLVYDLWTDTGGNPQWFAEGLAISPDGLTVVVDSVSGEGLASIYQRSSVEAWRELDGGYLADHVDLDGVGDVWPSRGHMGFSGDNRTLVVANVLNHQGQFHGQMYAVRRPADGLWADATLRIHASQRSPGVESRSGVEYLLMDSLDESRVLFSRGATWISDGGCTSEVADGLETVTCPIPTINGAVFVPKNTPDRTVAISGQVVVQQDGVADSAVRLEGELEVRISGPAPKLAEARLELANDGRGTTDTADDRPFSSLIERGGKTRLRLQILDEAGQPASTGSVSSLVVSTTLGGLTSLVDDGACTGASGLTTCTIPTSALTARNSDELLFDLAHRGTAGAATVWATLVSAEGETLTTERVAIDLAGAPTALAIAAPAATLLGYAPTEDTDPRNKTTLAVSASDEGGNRASVPDTLYSAKLTDPDGNTIALTGANRKAEVTWPLRENDAADGDLALRDGNPQARVTILAAKTAPLAIGEYTLELSAGPGANKLTATQKFNVAGGAAAVELSSDPAGQIPEGATVTFTAAVTDAAGNPVPDGTPVSFSEQSAGSNVALVLLSGSRQLTSGGEASVQLRAIGLGRAYVRATSDDASDIELVTVAVPPPPTLADLTGGLTIGGYSTWPSPQRVAASTLLAAMEGVERASVWDGRQWISYGVSNGLLLPGSIDFLLTQGDVFWLDAR